MTRERPDFRAGGRVWRQPPLARHRLRRRGSRRQLPGRQDHRHGHGDADMGSHHGPGRHQRPALLLGHRHRIRQRQRVGRWPRHRQRRRRLGRHVRRGRVSGFLVGRGRVSGFRLLVGDALRGQGRYFGDHHAHQDPERQHARQHHARRQRPLRGGGSAGLRRPQRQRHPRHRQPPRRQH